MESFTNHASVRATIASVGRVAHPGLSEHHFVTFSPTVQHVHALDMSLHPQTRRVFIFRHASRRGELLGLKWQDVNFTDGTLQVRRALIEVAGQGIIEAESKTAKARRSIILPSFAVDLLKQHRTKQLETRFSSRDTTDLNGHMKLGYKRNER